MMRRNSITHSHKIKFYFFILNLMIIQIYNAQQDIWIDKNESENYVARHECSFVQAGDKFIMFGGREKAQQLDIYDFKTDTWTTGGSAPKEFNHFQATFYEGFIWVIGSFKTNNFPKEMPADNIWLYFPPTKTWIKGPEIPKNRRRGGAGLVVYNNKFYLVGGNTIGHNGGYVNWFDEYDPVNNTWKILDDAPNARDHFSAVVVNNKLYALGGRHSGGPSGVFKPLIAPVDVFDFKTKTWSNLKNPLPTPRAAPGVALFNNEILVMGGEGEQKGPAYKLVEAYNLETNSWTKKAHMNYARHGTQAIICGEGIYIAGGSPNRGGGRQHNMEVYNKDKPEGKALIASKLIAPKKICIPTNSKKYISIKNKKGNTGIFISSITLIGKDKGKFKINTNYDLCLLSKKDEFQIEIEGIRNDKLVTAQLEIIYNENLKSVTEISSK